MGSYSPVGIPGMYVSMGTVLHAYGHGRHGHGARRHLRSLRSRTFGSPEMQVRASCTHNTSEHSKCPAHCSMISVYFDQGFRLVSAPFRPGPVRARPRALIYFSVLLDSASPPQPACVPRKIRSRPDSQLCWLSCQPCEMLAAMPAL